MQKELSIATTSRNEMVDITKQVSSVLKASGIKRGSCTVYTPHATAAITINENYDPNICDDFLGCLSSLIPRGRWKHDRVDGNADSHIKSALVGASETIPFNNGELLLGTWQSIMLADFDGPRQRKVIISIVGD